MNASYQVQPLLATCLYWPPEVPRWPWSVSALPTLCPEKEAFRESSWTAQHGPWATTSEQQPRGPLGFMLSWLRGTAPGHHQDNGLLEGLEVDKKASHSQTT